MSSLVRYAWFVLVVNVITIVVGALVTATGSGAGCGPSCPTCQGEVLHLALADVLWIVFVLASAEALQEDAPVPLSLRPSLCGRRPGDSGARSRVPMPRHQD